TSSDFSPITGFDLQWAHTILERALAGLSDELHAGGKAAQFERLRDFLTTEGTGEQYKRVARELEVADSSVAVLVHRLRQRFRQLVRAEVAQTVSSPTELEEEMRHLFDVLNE